MLKLTSPQRYFGTGFIVIDLDALRLREIQFKALSIAKEQHALPDQMDHDALTMALADDWLILDPKWNTSKGKASAGFSDGIIHFLGKVKPWHEDYAGNSKEEWFAILDRTAFASQRPAKLMGIAAAYKKSSRSIPTVDIVRAKLRRLIRSNLWFTRCILVSRVFLCASQVHSCLSGFCLRSP
jgi:lipopolysaccharide biosynthesis glycosyltransferase